VSSQLIRIFDFSLSRPQQRLRKMADNERGGSGNFANDPQHASEAGKKGGEHSHGQQNQGGGSQGQQGGNPGNFANDREKASEAGRKGGQS
jgi:hypothetical protein